MKMHRIGSITFGGTLVIFGILLLAQMFFPQIAYWQILRFWPVVLIFLGGEILIGNLNSEKVQFVYDGWAIVLTCVMLLFAGGMSLISMVLTNAAAYHIVF